MAGTNFGNDELANFKKTFFAECTELLADLDERLALMQDEVADSEMLNAVFRAVHSIKAGAGAFGFTQLVEFTHKFEALLDHLREGELDQTETVLALVVRSGDVLAALVEAAQAGESVSEDLVAEVAADLEKMLQEVRGEPSTDTAVAAPSASESDPTETQTFKIGFAPHAALFRHANEPLLLIRELRRLGELDVTCHTERLPKLTEMEAEDAYFSWTILVSTDKSEDDIREVFEFVEDDCDLTIEHVSALETIPPSVAPTAPSNLPQPEGAIASTSDRQPSPGTAKTATAPNSAKTSPADRQLGPTNRNVTSIRVDLERVDRLVNVVGELVIAQSMLAQQSYEGDSTSFETSQGHDEMARVTRELQECVMAIRMQPVKSVFARMPRLVREVSAKLNKQVRLVTEGEQTEVDKTVIEELADPLTHMIRNAIDHGIEGPDERVNSGKKPLGTIKLSARHAGGNIVIQVTDNGKGINRQSLLRKAIEKGIVSEEAKLSDEEIDDLIFAPGFSTAEAVTDVSGRGVGMDVVRRNINNLGGRISVQSAQGKGTRFTLTIPLTLAVMDGMLIAVGAERYILPLSSIVESFRPDREHIRALAGGGEVISMRGEYIRLIRLYNIFNIPNAMSDPCKGLVVVIETANGGKIGLQIDELIGQQQVVIKSLQENFDPVPGVSGATILGNGRVALILDIEQLKSMPPHKDTRQTRPQQSSQQSQVAQVHVETSAMTDSDGMQLPATV